VLFVGISAATWQPAVRVGRRRRTHGQQTRTHLEKNLSNICFVVRCRTVSSLFGYLCCNCVLVCNPCFHHRQAERRSVSGVLFVCFVC
jgi:hypothetical protein